MSKEIVNRVSKSKLVTIDPEEFYPDGKRVVFDISKWLYEGIILKEKEFRKYIELHDWSQYKDNYVALSCSTEAIVPSWAYLLISTKLGPYVKKMVVGDLELLETIIFQEIIESLQLDSYKDKPVIIKGCSNKSIPSTVSVQLIEKLLPVAASISFGEACSTVPLFKRKKA